MFIYHTETCCTLANVIVRSYSDIICGEARIIIIKPIALLVIIMTSPVAIYETWQT